MTTELQQQSDFSHARKKSIISRIPWLHMSRGCFAIPVIFSLIHAHILLLNVARWAILLLFTQYARILYGYVSVQSQEFTGGLFIFTGLYECIMLLMNKQPVLRWVIRFVSFLPIYFQLINHFKERLFAFIPLVFLCTPFIFISSLAPALYGVTIFTRLLQINLLILTVLVNFFYSKSLFLFLSKLLPYDSTILERRSHKEAADFTTWGNTVLSVFFITLTIISDFYFKKSPYLAMQMSSIAFIVTCSILGCIVMVAYHSLSTDLVYWREWLKVLVTVSVSLNIFDWVYNVKFKVLSVMDLCVIFLAAVLILFILIDFKVVLSVVALINFILIFIVFCTYNFINSSLTGVQLSTVVHGILCHFSVIGALLYVIHTSKKIF